MDVDGRGHPKVLTAGGPTGVADLLAELRQAVHAGVGGDPAGDGLWNPQAAVPVEDGDTEESLHERIKVQERQLLVRTLAEFAALPKTQHP